MKKIFIILTALGLFLVAACGPKDEPYNPNGKNGKDPKPEVVYDWPAIADSCTFVLIHNYLDQTKGTFRAFPNDNTDATVYLYWQQAHALDVILYAYIRVKDKDQARANEYRDYISKWFANNGNNYNTSRKGDGKHGCFFNDFIDDMAWICLTLLRMTEYTGNEEYANTAKQVFDKYIVPKAIKDSRGTSFPWQYSTSVPGGTCTNGPSCLTAVLLYKKYKDSSYLDLAKSIYDYMIATMLDDERIEDPPLTYTYGTFAEACRQLYHATNNSMYIERAYKLLYYVFTSFNCNYQGVLRHEGTDANQSLFKAVLIPYAVNYVLDEKVDPVRRKFVKEKLYFNAKTLHKNLDRGMYPFMFANYFWGQQFPGGTLSVGAQVSGASLMEGVARMVITLGE